MTALEFIRQRMNEKFSLKEQFLSRKDLMIRSQREKFSVSQLDTIRKQLTVVGYLKPWENGVYRMIKSVPENLTSHQLRKNYDEKTKQLNIRHGITRSSMHGRNNNLTNK